MEDHTYRTRGHPWAKRSRVSLHRSTRWKGWVVAVITLSAWPRVGVTQVVPTPESASTTVYFEFQVDQPAVMIGSLGVIYPADLRAAGVEGTVRFQFVVDTEGRVEAGTLKAVTSSNELFTSAGQLALVRARFSPARIRERKVRQLVELPIIFRSRAGY